MTTYTTTVIMAHKKVIILKGRPKVLIPADGNRRGGVRGRIGNLLLLQQNLLK
jgi:hypothetical protein